MGKRDGLRMQFHDQLKMDESTPGWQDRLSENVLSRDLPKIKRNQKGRQFGNHLSLTVGASFKKLVKVAAEKRGVTMVTYLRRSAAAFIAHDLGLTIGDVLADGPRPCHWGGSGVPSRDDPPETGQGYGPWVIGELHE